MKKQSKAFHILISALLSFSGYAIYYIIFQLAVTAFCPVTMAMNDYSMTEGFFPWGILIGESIYIFLVVYYFHKVTKGVTAGYLEGWMLLWLCGILGYTIISRRELETIAMIKDVRGISFFLILLAISSIFYKFVPQNEKEKSQKKKYSNRNKKILCALLAVPAGLLAYGTYRLLRIVIWTINVQLFVTPQLLERNHIFLDIVIEILSGCYFAALLQNFHKKTKGMLIGYMEAGYLLWIPVLWKLPYENGKWFNIYSRAEIEKWFLFIFLFLLMAVSIQNKKKEEEALKEKNIGLSFFLIIFSYGIYYIAVICMSIVSFFHFELAVMVASVVFFLYFFVIQQLSKGKLQWELLMAYGLFLCWVLLLGGICIVQGLNVEADILSQKEYVAEVIKDMAPNLKMYFAYGISVLAGEALAWGYRRRCRKRAL